MNQVLLPLRIGQRHPRWGSREAVRTAFIEKLVPRGLVPIPISGHLAPAMVDQLVATAAGILLPGGGDFRPGSYGEEETASCRPVSAAEDAFDLLLVARAFAGRIPLLGICRGCQALAIGAGGSLYQNIADVPGLEGEDHGQGNPNEDGTLPEGVWHEVDVDPASRAARIIGGKSRIRVLSEHHQAVRAAGTGLAVAGRSPAGVVEIVEAVDPAHFCFGIQAHPEAEASGDLEPFFDAFAEAARRRSS